MANFNRVILAGNLTRDPQLSYTPNNTPICKFGMAINRRWRDQQGNTQEETCFVDCTAFARRAETINQYMSKGQPLLIEGRLQYSQWTNQEGQKRSKLEVVVDNFQFLGGRPGGAGEQPGLAAAGQAVGVAPPEHLTPPAADDPSQRPAGDAEVPF